MTPPEVASREDLEGLTREASQDLGRVKVVNSPSRVPDIELYSISETIQALTNDPEGIVRKIRQAGNYPQSAGLRNFNLLNTHFSLLGSSVLLRKVDSEKDETLIAHGHYGANSELKEAVDSILRSEQSQMHMYGTSEEEIDMFDWLREQEGIYVFDTRNVNLANGVVNLYGPATDSSQLPVLVALADGVTELRSALDVLIGESMELRHYLLASPKARTHYTGKDGPEGFEFKTIVNPVPEHPLSLELGLVLPHHYEQVQEPVVEYSRISLCRDLNIGGGVRYRITNMKGAGSYFLTPATETVETIEAPGRSSHIVT